MAEAAIPPPTSAQTEFSRRVIYLMLFRLVLISLVLGATILLSWLSDVDPLAPNSLVLFAIIGTTYLLTLIYALAIKQGLDPMRLADGQVIADLITTTMLVHVTGGAQSAYTFFFPLSIIGAATVRFRAGAVTVAIASVVLFVGVSLLGWTEILPTPAGQRILPNELTNLELGRTMALNLAAFAGVAFLAFNLGAQIQRTSASLESERSAAADLIVLHEDIVRSLSSGLITVDRKATVRTLNQAACEILQTTVAASMGTPVERVLRGLTEKTDHLAERDSTRFDLSIERADKTSLILGVAISPLHDNRDVVLGRILSFQDLTELREMEKQVKHAERLAVIGSIAAGVAHEIRNPLASISGSIELLGNNPGEGEDTRPLMEIITREVDRLNGMINDLLDYANPQLRKLIEFDLAVLVTETIQVFAQDRGFEGVEVELAEDSLREGLRLVADPGKLRQVLWNLLRNAAEATSDSGGTIVVRATHSDDFAEIEVTDDGPGLTPDNLERVFEPFFTTKSRGSGLGLATCHNIMTEHRGTIRVESEVGQGCCFTTRIPLDLQVMAPGDSSQGLPAYTRDHD